MSFEQAAAEHKKAGYGHINFTPKAKKKILLIGHAQHGKDTTAEIIQYLYDYKFESSSVAASRIFLFDALKEKYGYLNPIDCFVDRVNRRKEWHDLIWEYNSLDPTRLARAIMKDNDIYVGMRNDIECEACVEAKVFDLVIGVYDPRKPLEPEDSFKINMWEQADLVIPNSTSIQDLEARIKKLSPLFN